MSSELPFDDLRFTAALRAERTVWAIASRAFSRILNCVANAQEVRAMRLFSKRALATIMLILPLAGAFAEQNMIEDFEFQPEKRWQFIGDSVMGGVSTGQVEFARENGKSYARMTGRVSTANNGGFVQFRMDLPAPLPKDAAGVRLIARGNEQRYFVHLRTSGTVLPWQYYQAGFEVSGVWAEIRLPFTGFNASGRLLRVSPRPESVKSVGIVAFGRDHDAEIEVREVSYY
ncbi:CIA30 family protein [Roseovarius marisflavi]|nr:CIA30 family protein [Roseovarius marisflavi]